MRSILPDWEVELARWLKPFLEQLGHKARRRICPLYVAVSPAFEFREPGYARQQNIGGLIKRGAYHLIAGPRNPAGDVLFPRLILFRR